MPEQFRYGRLIMTKREDGQPVVAQRTLSYPMKLLKSAKNKEEWLAAKRAEFQETQFKDPDLHGWHIPSMSVVEDEKHGVVHETYYFARPGHYVLTDEEVPFERVDASQDSVGGVHVTTQIERSKG